MIGHMFITSYNVLCFQLLSSYFFLNNGLPMHLCHIRNTDTLFKTFQGAGRTPWVCESVGLPPNVAGICSQSWFLTLKFMYGYLCQNDSYDHVAG